MAVTFLHPILGQKVVVDIMGIGRVTNYCDNFPDCWIEVQTYADGVKRQYDPKNVCVFDLPQKRRCK